MADVRTLSDAWSLSAQGLSITKSAVSLCVLRVRDPDVTLLRALGEAFKMDWPSDANTVSGADPLVACLAPGEWALFAAPERLAGLLADVGAGRLCHLADVSAGRRRWRIEGPRHRDIIAKGCSLDTHGAVFGPGRCAQTLLAQIPVLLVSPDGEEIDLVADVSLAGHLRMWLADAAREFQA